MKRSTTKRWSIVAALGLIATVLSIAATTSTVGAQAGSDAVTYSVQFRNLTDGQWLTPPNYAAHTRQADVWSLGGAASDGVRAVAENGGVPILAAELSSAIDDAGLGVSGVGADAPIAPGEQSAWEFTTTADRFSLVSMLICTNDGFAGLDSRRLPTVDGHSTVWRVRAFDAGTEQNTERRADLVPAPFCGEGDGNGESDPSIAQNRRIRTHNTIRGVGDLDASFDWVGPVAEIVITRVETVPTYTVTIENTTTGQWLTPPNYAAHTNDLSIFRVGRPASPGLQAVAENGAVPVLAAELSAAIDEQGLGVSGVGADAPIGPGESVTFTVATTAHRFSLASMVICTNDGFAGLERVGLPNRAGATRSFAAQAYDAGTEINTELRADLVPAPFCGEGGGSGESNPELAEDWVVTPHRTLRDAGDLDASFDWRGAVARVSITRN